MELRVNKISEVQEIQLKELGFKESTYYRSDSTWYKDYGSNFAIILRPIINCKQKNSVVINYMDDINYDECGTIDASVEITDMYVDLILLMKYGIVKEVK